MIVVFQSESENKSIKRVNRILDAYANRIGRRSWMTAITQSGLDSVYSELRRIATKDTSVSCILIKGRIQTELLWIVGRRDRFDSNGNVSVNETSKTKYIVQNEDKWNHLPLISALVGLSALWHDVGKSNDWFQSKLKNNIKSGDPLRHEWVSCMLLFAYIKSVEASSDKEWLKALSEQKFDERKILTALDCLKNDSSSFFQNSTGFPVFDFIAWLILSHHRIPYSATDINKLNGFKALSISDFHLYQKYLNSQNGGYATNKEYKTDEVFSFSKGLEFFEDSLWTKESAKWAKRLLGFVDQLMELEKNNSYYEILFLSRCALVIGDHRQSSLIGKASKATSLIANVLQNGKPNQTLVEHLLGVMSIALSFVHFIPFIHDQLPPAYDIRTLKAKSIEKYKWQDKAIEAIKKAKKEDNLERVGVFVVNMASTGCGKTIANAKILHGLSSDDSLRCSILLGLRTLTLQTGNEYKTRLGIDKEDLSIIVGSKAYIDIVKEEINDESNVQDELSITGVEACEIPEDYPIKKILDDESALKMVYPPILICTIDQMIKASEKTKGAQNVIPMLRLLSSDIVIDEIDDYSGSDLVAVGRFVYLCGVFGRKIVISSATIPPEVAEGLSAAYQRGWGEYAKLHNVKKKVLCLFVDEFSSSYGFVEAFPNKSDEHVFRQEYKNNLKLFVERRIQKLKRRGSNKKGEVIHIGTKTVEEYFSSIEKEIHILHERHFEIDVKTSRKVSFGLVRFSNIEQCIKFSRYISKIEPNVETELRFMTYHARELMIIRHEQESYLDKVLCRKVPNYVFEDSDIRYILDKSESRNVIFILISSPVEELGRDHDFSWAVIEPASYRSIVQTSGRVLRHRDTEIDEPNVGILQYNWKALHNDRICYRRPGFETNSMRLPSHDVTQLIDQEVLKKGITSIPRISFLDDPKVNDFIGLEHLHVFELLKEKSTATSMDLASFYSGPTMLTALSQKFCPFRVEDGKSVEVFLLEKEKGGLGFFEYSDGEWKKIEQIYGITFENDDCNENKANIWKKMSYIDIVQRLCKIKGVSFNAVAKKYGGVCIDPNKNWKYSDDFGFEEEKI